MFKEFKETMAKKFKENVLTDSNIRNLKKKKKRNYKNGQTEIPELKDVMITMKNSLDGFNNS